MTDIPHQSLSGHLSDRLDGFRVKTAVFVTYEFDPCFFEDEILPLLLNTTLSQVPQVRRAQLEQSIGEEGLQLAVYYDCNVPILGEGSPCLDVRRIPVSATGAFHSKLVLILAEKESENGAREERLFVGTPSANLTRSGWWKNIECCHFEELSSGESSYFPAQLRSYLSSIRRLVDKSTPQDALDTILGFLKKAQSAERKVRGGPLRTQFHGGTASFAGFLEEALKGAGHVEGMHLEIISPFIKKEALPYLDKLIEATKPASVTVALLSGADGKCLFNEETYRAFENHPLVTWGQLETRSLGMKKSDDGTRFVHAKLYRYYQSRPRREVYFVGSVNLTQPAHQQGGNHESGFLVEVEKPSGQPWLSASKPPQHFTEREQKTPEGEDGRHIGSHFQLRFDWSAKENAGQLCWGGASREGTFVFRANGREVLRRMSAQKGVWEALSPEESAALQTALTSTSVLQVEGEKEGTPTYLLVQEENMSQKPSLLFQLTAAEVLKYWSLLSTEQREAFLDQHLPLHALRTEGTDLAVLREKLRENETFFGLVAGTYHGFARLEETVMTALAAGEEARAASHLLGRKFHSLGNLLELVQADESRDVVDRYLVFRCARLLIDRVRATRAGEKLFATRPRETAQLEETLSGLGAARHQLVEGDASLTTFLDWFDEMFDLQVAPPKPTSGSREAS